MEAVLLHKSTSSSINSTSAAWDGGVGTLFFSGTYGGATVKLQVRPTIGSTAWIDVGNETSLTSASAFDIGNFDLGNCDLRVAVSSGSTTTDVTAIIF